MIRWFVPGALALAAVSACGGGVQFPGDELLGTFRVQATVLDAGCPAILSSELPPTGGFSFEGTLSREKASGNAFLTLNGISRDGTFDGQIFTSTYSAPRRFTVVVDGGVVADCNDNEFTVDESLRVTLLSPSQDLAIGSRCPDDVTALLEAGGAPAAPDGGVAVPPASQEDGFDAVRLCGVLVDTLKPPDGCGVDTCAMTYRVEGVTQR